MRRKLLYTSLAGTAALSAGIVAKMAELPVVNAQPAPPAIVPAAGPALPINQVVLFSSGVGYFQRAGEVDGNARVDLSFPVQDINDLLKSMVVQDQGQGHISAVSYDSQAPVDKTLRSFAINLTGNPTFGQILNQARGEKVEAVLQQSTNQPATLTGVVVGTEHKREAVGKEVVESEFINLWCAEGMRSVKMADVQRIRFLNPVMDSEVKKALETLALSHDTQKKAVSINCIGSGKRNVKVGYVVENTQDEDWNNVRMSLVSGRPISFQMDLYQPLFVNRPVVEPELFASLRPPTYQGALEKQQQWAADGANAPQNRDRGRAEGKGGGAAPGDEQRRMNLAGAPRAAATKALADSEMDIKRGVANAAAAMELGDFFQYAIEQPVSLARQKSAMLPIVTQEVEGTKVSIYNQATHPKFPLLGLKFKNSTNLHLMQGPITVFDGASYAGDARIQDIQPKEERLISYAIDLGTEVEAIVPNPQDRITNIKVNKGIIEATHKVQQSKTYNMKNRSEHDRTVIVEHPFRPEFKLMAPEKPSERARDVYRFEVPVKAAGGTGKLEVVEERDVLQTVSISNTDDQTIRIFLNNNVTSTKVKDALNQAIALKTKMANTQRELAQLNRTLKDINDDQTRLRANLKEMPPTAAAYKRYLDKFDKQETEIEQLQGSIKQMQATEFAQRRDLDNYLGALSVE